MFFINFLLYFFTLQLTHIFSPPSPSRACHSSQRQCTGSSFPERVPAGHGVKPNGGILLRTGPSFLAEFHIQVQSYRGRGPETSVTAWVPQCVAPGRGFTQVRAQPTWQQAGFNVISLLFFVTIYLLFFSVNVSVILKLLIRLIVSDMNNNQTQEFQLLWSVD